MFLNGPLAPWVGVGHFRLTQGLPIVLHWLLRQHLFWNEHTMAYNVISVTLCTANLGGEREPESSLYKLALSDLRDSGSIGILHAPGHMSKSM